MPGGGGDKDIGKAIRSVTQLEALGGEVDMTPPQGSSQLLVLKELLDDLERELELINQKRQNVLSRMLTVNELFKEKVNAQQIAEFKDRRSAG